MSRRHIILRRSLAGVAALVVLVLVMAVVAVVVITRQPLPSTSGEVSVPGLGADVRVVRDEEGIPHIYASTSADLFMAQGYVQAQDRFFEMDYRRHVTSGRLSELVGDNPDAIEADKVIRTLGWREVAEAEWELIDAQTRAYLTAYAAGVNAYLDGRSPSSIAVEYTVLGTQVTVEAPEPWDPVDSLAWLKAMAWDLRGNYDAELGRAQAYASIGDVGRVNQLFPAYPQDINPPILDEPTAGANKAAVEAAAAAEAQRVADEAAAAAAAETSSYGTRTIASTATPTAGQDADTVTATSSSVTAPESFDLTEAAFSEAVDSAAAAIDAVPVLVGDGEGIGSNSWVVSGALTDTGSPLLANDPHLALGAPSIWSQVGLHCNEITAQCPFEVSGFSFAGFPGVVVGHNSSLAWGITNLGADVTDFFLERTTGDTYERDGEQVPFTTRTETIKVNGGEDIQLEVRSTVHGPLISDVLSVSGVDRTPVEAPLTDSISQAFSAETETTFEVALGWTALEPGHTAEAIFAMDLAKTPEDIRAAAEKFEVPAQNITFATVDGHIGYQAPGKIPVRAAVAGPVPSDGTWPRPGWDSRYDWQGYVDSASMPSVLDPAEGFIVAANQAVGPSGAGPYLSNDWDYGYRSERIREMLQQDIDRNRKISSATMARIQSDTYNPYAEMLVPTLLEQDIENTFDGDGQDLLVDWDYQQTADSAAAAYFSAVWVEVLALTFDDELPDEASPTGGSRWLEVVRTQLADPTSTWWDDRSTVNVVETRDEVLTQALVKARESLTMSLGRTADEWQWGKLHQLKLEHPVLGGDSVPALVHRIVNPSPVEMGGGSSIVNATGWDASSGSYDVTTGPSMRMVVDLADFDQSTWVVVTGASGHPGSAHYDDQLETWAAGESYSWPFTASAVSAVSEDVLTLKP
ncbi:penicillin acylase family protein [Sanguibacter antarcticus]|uniref:Penicillin amidase n=1 Tax=Sanguibacter antarcticus TaxID=372484 RepID=A0A2A9E1R2_9MICO|nr:penicillin acylase family protein [Sanguibacter antarcticus]PFG32305.1 penicillin amidase [Sanguibacter antarcticus]